MTDEPVYCVSESTLAEAIGRIISIDPDHLRLGEAEEWYISPLEAARLIVEALANESDSA